jgi:hypothetical protein
MKNRRRLVLRYRLEASGVWTFGSRFSLRPGGTRDSSPAIYRRVGHKYDLRPGGTLEVGSGLLHGEEGKARRIPYFAPNSGVPSGYRLEAYATLLSELARQVWKFSCKRFRVPAVTWQRRKVA